MNFSSYLQLEHFTMRSILNFWAMSRDSLTLSTRTSTFRERETGSSSSAVGSTQLLISTTTPSTGTLPKLCKFTFCFCQIILLCHINVLLGSWFIGFEFSGGMWTLSQSEFSETTSCKAFHSRTSKVWECTLVCGTQKTGQHKVVGSRPIGPSPLSRPICATSDLGLVCGTE